MRRTNASWFCAVLFTSACQGTEPSRTEAPVDTIAGEVAWDWAGPNEAALVVPVHVNGSGPYSFVLDTGATLTCVSEALATELSLPSSTGQVGFGVGVGGSGRMRLVRLDSIRLGAARAEDLPACALDLTAAEKAGIEFSGLLGLNFLRSFRVVLDFERGVILLHQREGP